MIIKQFGNNYFRLKDRIIVWQKLITSFWLLLLFVKKGYTRTMEDV